ncbi:hypothetical protein J1605_010375 [Eschrichtius robustus]|uniref:Uncharacterized protein n=1 Tax=Eschrichtius robustus TaxID=9764 RepID=A0AB34GSC2_ESCRO|nr:hypothetical protein J1605_010375 [Eschrichtius robustus]
MAEQIPLCPVRSAAAAANCKRAAYFSAAGPGPGAERPSRRPSPPGPVGSAQGGRPRSPAGAPEPGRASTLREGPGRCHDPGARRRRAERRGGRASGSGGCSLK